MVISWLLTCIFWYVFGYQIIMAKLFHFRPSHLKKVQQRNFGDGRKTEITNLKLCHPCKCNFLNCFSQLWCMNKYVPFRQNHESTVVGPRWTWGHFPNWLFNSRAKKVRNEKKTWIVRSQNSTVRISKIYFWYWPPEKIVEKLKE